MRIEPQLSQNSFGPYSGAQQVSQEIRVRIKVRIPELHPFPDPEIYGPEGSDGIISLYPTFIAINSDIPTPAVGEIVYVDYGDRDNLEDPKYFGLVSNKPIFGGANFLKQADKIVNLFGGLSSKLSDTLSPPIQRRRSNSVEY